MLLVTRSAVEDQYAVQRAAAKEMALEPLQDRHLEPDAHRDWFRGGWR